MELYHSNTYYGLEVSDGLKHYKYLRKYKKNGKWKYVYRKTSLNPEDHNAYNHVNYGIPNQTTFNGNTHGFGNTIHSKPNITKDTDDIFSHDEKILGSLNVHYKGQIERGFETVTKYLGETLESIGDGISEGFKFIKNLFS